MDPSRTAVSPARNIDHSNTMKGDVARSVKSETMVARKPVAITRRQRHRRPSPIAVVAAITQAMLMLPLYLIEVAMPANTAARSNRRVGSPGLRHARTELITTSRTAKLIGMSGVAMCA